MKRLVALLALLFWSALTIAAQQPMKPQPAASPLTIYTLDIGQGDSLLVVSPTGKTVLVDTGDTGNDKHVLDALMTYAGAKRIDLFIASHPHADHIGSADLVITGSTVARVLDSAFPHTTATYERYLQAIQKSGAQYIQATPGQTFDIGGGAVMTVIAPIKPYFTKAELRPGATEPNANSVVVRLDYKSFSMLFTGDAEAETEARMIANKANLQAKVLKVGHHGSRYATSEAFLQAVKPEAAVISVGAANNYGHPTGETLTRLKSAGVKVYRTDLQGEIKITSDGSTYQISTQKTATPEAIFTGRLTKNEAASTTSTPTAAATTPTPAPAAPTSTPTAQPSPSSTPATSAALPVIGNKDSKIYHLPGCSSYDKVSEKNRIYFKTAAEAEAAGYRRAKNCSPTESTPATPATSSTKSETPAKTETPTPAAKPAPDSAPVTPSNPATTATQSPIIGNKNSKIYHRLGCPGYKTVSEQNQVKFTSAEEAEKAGYRAAKNCPPGN